MISIMQVKNKLIKTIAGKAAVAVFWLFVWWLLYLLIDRPVILASPIQTFLTLFGLVVQKEFWSNVIFSLLRILLGLLIGCILGVVLSFFTSKSKTVYEIFKPVLTLAKTVPVVSFIMLLWLAFFKYKGIMPIVISALMVFPIMWSDMSTAHAAMDKKLLEMANCCAKPFDVFLYVRLPHLFPYFISGIATSIGMAWKAGIAAEVICSPLNSIGREIHTARANLESDTLLAWTAVVVALSIFLEFLLVKLLKKIKFRPKLHRSETPTSNGQSFALVFDRISKHYGEHQVLDQFSYVFPNGKTTAILGQSGCGKTTLLSIAASLTEDDQKRYQMPPTAPGIIFQEHRLIPGLTAAENILFANRGANVKKILTALSLSDVSEKYLDELSGGMQRRVAIGRAIAFGGGIGIFDEPFTGLDEDTKALCAHALFSAYKGKTVLFVTHDAEDAKRYADEILKMS